MISGAQLIGFQTSQGGTSSFQATDPRTGDALAQDFLEATRQEVNDACHLALSAFDRYKGMGKDQRATFLETIADEIEAAGSTLIDRASAETALPEGRLNGERGRTTNQLRLFAKVVREGSWVDARIDQGDVDIRSMQRALGPVAIFGASNFPLAFSVAGGDTASALAAGCPVVVKAHPAHPGTSELVGQAIIRAAQKCGMPEGVFSLVQGQGHEVGMAMVQHDGIKAVGFTGSLKGGKALFDLAAQRSEPIPVYAEMGSSNPVFVLPGALAARADSIAEGLAKSVGLGVGQFCTNPGLVILAKPSDQFESRLIQEVSENSAGTMLTDGIRMAYDKAVDERASVDQIETLTSGRTGSEHNSVAAQVFKTTAQNYLTNRSLEEEVFGPSTLIVQGGSTEELIDVAKSFSGHLTATIHAEDSDWETYAPLIQVLEQKVGRLVINGFPTGVAVCHAMIHGGPYPATTAPQTTSVGTTAIRRFSRPICYQDFPNHLLPNALKKENPDGIWRLVDGEFLR